MVVSFSESGTDTKIITMSAPSDYDGKDVHIAFTIDGTTPDVTFDSTAYNEVVSAEGAKNTDKILERYLEYFDYGTADIYDPENKPEFDTTTTITAIAFYVDPTGGENGKPKAVKGASAQTYEVQIEGKEVTAKASDDNKNGGTFKLAKTGNSNTIHYFDTSDAPFDASDSFKNCYYQIQFSYKGSGKGNWYLYVRQAGTGTLVNPSSILGTTIATKYVASGTYKGANFDNSKGTVADGNIQLYKSGNTSEVWKTVEVENSSDNAQFELTTENENGLASDAK